jgi:hypothetical protein
MYPLSKAKTIFSTRIQDLQDIRRFGSDEIQFSFEEEVLSDEDQEQPFLFDIAWEVARKVGGIYTVSYMLDI